MNRLGLLVVGVAALLAAAPGAAAKPKPIPASAAFVLPTVKQCVDARTLVLRVRELKRARWISATVMVDGKRVKRVRRPERAITVRRLPQATFVLTITARTDDGRGATATRTYHPCPRGGKPSVVVPPGEPPTTLVTRDVITGTGAKARRGRTATVQYVLVAWSTREELDSSWSRGLSFEFVLGRGDVIEGFERGVDGMRVGGRREVIVPPELGYGAAGSGPIGPNETLMFVLDLVAVAD